MEKTYTFITGASSGMGEATAKLFSKDRNLILHGRDMERLNAVASECVKNGNCVLTFPYDLESVDSLAKDLKDFLLAHEAKVEAFAHFAGMTDLLPINKTQYKIGMQVMNINYFSATEIISTLLKRKVNADVLKNILFVSSVVTQTGKKYQPHYVASKGAIESLANSLAIELAPHVRVNTIAPGSFFTNIVKTVFFDENAEHAWNPNTLLPAGEVEEIANVSRFLLSEEARYLTGQRIEVDGGEHYNGY